MLTCAAACATSPQSDRGAQKRDVTTDFYEGKVLVREFACREDGIVHTEGGALPWGAGYRLSCDDKELTLSINRDTQHAQVALVYDKSKSAAFRTFNSEMDKLPLSHVAYVPPRSESALGRDGLASGDRWEKTLEWREEKEAPTADDASSASGAQAPAPAAPEPTETTIRIVFFQVDPANIVESAWNQDRSTSPENGEVLEESKAIGKTGYLSRIVSLRALSQLDDILGENDHACAANSSAQAAGTDADTSGGNGGEEEEKKAPPPRFYGQLTLHLSVCADGAQGDFGSSLRVFPYLRWIERSHDARTDVAATAPNTHSGSNASDSEHDINTEHQEFSGAFCVTRDGKVWKAGGQPAYAQEHPRDFSVRQPLASENLQTDALALLESVAFQPGTDSKERHVYGGTDLLLARVLEPFSEAWRGKQAGTELHEDAVNRNERVAVLHYNLLAYIKQLYGEIESTLLSEVLRE